MKQQYPLTDFDFTVEEVSLVHKNRFVPHFRWTDYRNGRLLDGLSYCLSGCGTFRFGDQEIVLSAGEALLLPAGSAYTVGCEGEEPFVHYTVNFRLSPLTEKEKNEASAYSAIRSRELIYRLSTAETHPFLPLFEKLLSAWQDKMDGYRIFAKAKVGEMLYRYFRAAGQAHRPANLYGSLLPAIERMKDLSANDSIGELAALCRMSESGFRRKFEEVFSVSPIAYKNEKRILRSKDLLLSGEYSVTDVASAVGFEDANYFSRLFRQYVGVPPREYIKN